MGRKYQYQQLNMQYGRIIYVNGQWNGSVYPNKDNEKEALQSCPYTWEYLDKAGADGWELISAVNQTIKENQEMQLLFLKKEIP